MMSLGEKILAVREARKMSQRELAEKSGVTAATICGYEKNKRIPDFITMQKIAKALRWKLTFFMEDSEDE